MPSDRWIARFLKRHSLRWKKATKLGEARMLSMTPGNVSFMFKAWRECLVKVAHDMWRVYCWDQTPLETDLPRRVRFKAVGMIGANMQPIVRGRTTIGETFMVWLCIGVMGQVLHPVVIFRGGGDIAQYDVDDRRPGRPRRVPADELAAEEAERRAGPPVLHRNIPEELEQMADEENEELDPADAEVVRAALQAENEGIEEDLPGDVPYRRRVTGRLARFKPAQFPIECNKWGFIKQPNGCTDNYTAGAAFQFFVEQIEREHPDGPKVVLMDNMVCHQQPELLERMLDHHIFPLFIPPNRFFLLLVFLFCISYVVCNFSTHRFMPLDRVFNGVFKHYYNSELRECIGANVMPNMRVILTCVSRALDRICPDVTKAGWRGFYPYDRVGMINIEEQKAAVQLHANLRRPNMERILRIQSSADHDRVPDELRLYPRQHAYPEPDAAVIQLPANLAFEKEDFNYRPNHPFLLRNQNSQQSDASLPLIPPLPIPPPAAIVEEDQDHEEDLDDMVADLDEIREEIGAPFRRQQQLGAPKKTFTVLGLVTAETIRNELQRMRQVAIDEDHRKVALQEEKRRATQLRQAAARQQRGVGRGRPRGPRGAGRGGRGRGNGCGHALLLNLTPTDSEPSQPSQATSSGTVFTSSSGSSATNLEEDEEMKD